jgi:UDP-N-acetylglucosamine acyltransferase
MAIHPTAVVDKTAEVDASAEIGAYAIVEPQCHIGAGVRLYPHAYVSFGTTLGPGCEIHPFAVVGHLPQDLKFAGEPTYTIVGEGTIVREHGTIHRGTEPGTTTRVGRNCYIMSTGHIGHNCTIGDNVIIVNGALLSGHITVGDRAFISGSAGLHQFVRVGELVMISGLTRVPMDVPPFMTLAHDGVVGPNVVGLRRAGLSSAERQEIRTCYRLLYRSGMPFPAAIDAVAERVQHDPGRRLVAFLRGESKRGFMAGLRRHAARRAGSA